MKKLLFVFIGFFSITVSAPINVLATQEIDPGIRLEGMETDDGTMWWQYAYWDTTGGFPEYIGYIEFNEEVAKFEVGLTENTPENQQAILEMVPNSQVDIIFTKATYSRENQKAFRVHFSEKYMGEDSAYNLRGMNWDKDALAVFAEADQVAEYKSYFENAYPGRVVVHPEEQFNQDPVDWIGHYLAKLPPEPAYGTEEYIIHHFGEDDGTIDWRYQLWSNTENYPDNLGFIQINANQVTWEIGLVENTIAAQQEILKLVPNSVDNIVFMDADYSLNALTEVQENIIQNYLQANEHPQIYALGIMNNRVIVTVAEEVAEEYATQFNEKYGEMVQTEIGLPNQTLEETVLIEADPISHLNTSWRTLFLLGGMAAVGIFLIWQRNHSVANKQTTTGQIIDENYTLSDTEIEGIIKHSIYEPSDDVYQSLLKMLKNKNSIS